MSFMKKSAAALVLTGVAAATSTALAAGFQLTEQSSLGAGRAYAGAGIVGDDLSAVHYNPAGMTLLEGTRFQAGGVWIGLNADYSSDISGESENGRLKGQMIPAGYVTHQVNDKIWLGFGMTVPYGMGTEYSRDWEGKDRGTSAKIYTFDMNPNIAWKVSEYISVGAGVSVQYAKAKLGMGMMAHGAEAQILGTDIAHAKVEADSWDWGYNLGIMISPTDKLRFGLAYRSSIEHDAEGDVKLSNFGEKIKGYMGSMAALVQDGYTMGTSATLETPDTIMLTGTWETTDRLRLSGLIRWANWSNFKNLTLNNDLSPSTAAALEAVIGAGINSQPGMSGMGSMVAGALVDEMKTTTLENDWQDTWLFSIGADYRVNDAFTVRGGVAYETSPIDRQETRMAVIPDTDRVWLSLGASWYPTQDLQFDIGGTYLMGVGDKDLYNSAGQKIGKYESLDAYLLGVQMQYRF